MLSNEQSKTLRDIRDYEVWATWLSGLFAIITAIAIGCACNSCDCNTGQRTNDPPNKGGVAFSVVCGVVAVWLHRRRAEYKSEIKYLQEQDGLSP